MQNDKFRCHIIQQTVKPPFFGHWLCAAFGYRINLVAEWCGLKGARAVMKRKPRIFISYKTGLEDGLTQTANMIRSRLVQAGWDNERDLFMDTHSLEAGRDWNDQIYENITRSDILLLLLAEKTTASIWVRREVDVAKGARVPIIPVVIREEFDVKAALESFDLTYVQYVKIVRGDEDEYKKLFDAIEDNKAKARLAQMEWLRILQEGEKRRLADSNQKALSYTFISPHDPARSCNVHLAAGDLFEHKNIDVIVNSENDFMQMARVFDIKTVSALARYYGARLDEAERMLEDTIQGELNQQIAQTESKCRPVGLGTAIITSAGLSDPPSRLRSYNNTRYLFHIATVSARGEGVDRELESTLTESGIKRLVRKALQTVEGVNSKKGCVSPKRTPQLAEQKASESRYQPISSIIIPIFGAGHGGRRSDEIIPSLVKGVKEFLLDQAHKPTFTLQDIYIAAYYEEDVEFLREAMTIFDGLATKP